MTKAKARARAKARAIAKAKKPATKGPKDEAKARPEQFDTKPNNSRNMGRGADVQTKTAMTRGSARSR